jgi:predicted transcriptional regulator
MADWWMDDTEIVVSYRLAKDKVLQIQVISQLCDATLSEVAEKLIRAGEITKEDAKKYVKMISDFDRHCKITPAMQLYCKQLYDDHYSDRAIAEIVGVTRESVIYWRQKNNLEPNDPARTIDGRWYKHGKKRKRKVEVER